MSEIKSESQPTWADIEVALATEIVEESKKKSRKWFTAWIVTAAALVASNLARIAGEMK
jgi:hypothetical protein